MWFKEKFFLPLALTWALALWGCWDQNKINAVKIEVVENGEKIIRILRWYQELQIGSDVYITEYKRWKDTNNNGQLDPNEPVLNSPYRYQISDYAPKIGEVDYYNYLYNHNWEKGQKIITVSNQTEKGKIIGETGNLDILI